MRSFGRARCGWSGTPASRSPRLRDLGVNAGTLGNWVTRTARRVAISTECPATRPRRSSGCALVAALRMERDVLIALRGPVGEGGDEVSLAAFIADQRTSHRVPHTVACGLLGLSVSRYYKWIKRQPTARQRRRGELDAKVRELFEASGGTYGSPRVHAELVTVGWRISVNTVAELMRRQRLAGRKPKRRMGLTKQDRMASKFPDLLRRDFTALAPNRRWCGDMTHLPTD
jgi:hypothetical protein